MGSQRFALGASRVSRVVMATVRLVAERQCWRGCRGALRRRASAACVPAHRHSRQGYRRFVPRGGTAPAPPQGWRHWPIPSRAPRRACPPRRRSRHSFAFRPPGCAAIPAHRLLERRPGHVKRKVGHRQAARAPPSARLRPARRCCRGRARSSRGKAAPSASSSSSTTAGKSLCGRRDQHRPQRAFGDRPADRLPRPPSRHAEGSSQVARPLGIETARRGIARIVHRLGHRFLLLQFRLGAPRPNRAA